MYIENKSKLRILSSLIYSKSLINIINHKHYLYCPHRWSASSRVIQGGMLMISLFNRLPSLPLKTFPK